MSALDIFVILLLLGGGAVGLVRGFVHELLSLFAWVAAIAMLWAFVGTLGALPPIVRKESLSTFGGRLRLLVAGGVVLPLAILTLFLHQRIAGRELRRYAQLRPG